MSKYDIDNIFKMIEDIVLILSKLQHEDFINYDSLVAIERLQETIEQLGDKK